MLRGTKPVSTGIAAVREIINYRQTVKSAASSTHQPCIWEVAESHHRPAKNNHAIAAPAGSSVETSAGVSCCFSIALSIK